MKNFKFILLITLFISFGAFSKVFWIPTVGDIKGSTPENAVNNLLTYYSEKYNNKYEFDSCKIRSDGDYNCFYFLNGTYGNTKFDVLVRKLSNEKFCEKKIEKNKKLFLEGITEMPSSICNDGCEQLIEPDDNLSLFLCSGTEGNKYCMGTRNLVTTGKSCKVGSNEEPKPKLKDNKCVKTEDGRTLCNGEELPNGCAFANGKKFCTSDLKDKTCTNDLTTGQQICRVKVKNQDCIFNVDKMFCPETPNSNGSDNNGSGDNGSGDNGSGDNGSGDNGSGDNGSGDNGCSNGNAKDGKNKGSSVSGQGCNTSLICKGDAVQCYMARKMKEKACKNEEDQKALNDIKNEGVGEAGPLFEKEVTREDITSQFTEEVDLSKNSFDVTGFLGVSSGSCFPPKEFTLFGHTIPIDLTLFCSFLNMISYVFVAIAYFKGVLIVAGE